jgi:hypothetical protein
MFISRKRLERIEGRISLIEENAPWVLAHDTSRRYCRRQSVGFILAKLLDHLGLKIQLTLETPERIDLIKQEEVTNG